RRRPRTSRSISTRSSRPDVAAPGAHSTIGSGGPLGALARHKPPAETSATIGLSALVTLLVIMPLLALAVGAATETRGLSGRSFVTVLAAGRIIGNTVLVGAGTTVIAVTLGGLLGLALARINTPGRGLLSQLVTFPLYITPLLTAIAWSWLGSPRSGLIN